MTTTWDSLYLPSDDQGSVVTSLDQIMTALGYTRYDPFASIPGKSYPQTIRLFVSPPQAGWVRIIGRPDPRMLGALSRKMCLYLRLEGDSALIETYTRGYPRDTEESLAPYLRHDADALRRALNGAQPEIAPADQADMSAALPDDIKAMAEQIDDKQAQKLISRVSRTLVNKVSQGKDGAAMADAARDMIAGSAPRWESAGGRRIQAVMACLTLPENWQQPDFNTLRDAYQLQARQRARPGARLYPGDEEIMAQVPNALDYEPVYGGCDE